MSDSGRSMREDAQMLGRAMGKADREDGEPYKPDGPFRIPGPNHSAYSAGYEAGWAAADAQRVVERDAQSPEQHRAELDAWRVQRSDVMSQADLDRYGYPTG